LLRAFASDAVLRRAAEALERESYLTHEFGDTVLIEATSIRRQHPPEPVGQHHEHEEQVA
jgi:hypothetical protein